LFQKQSPEELSLNTTITELERDMQTHDGDSEEYATCLNRLERLYKLREKSARKGLDPNTLVLVAGNLLGILIIVGHEQAHVVTSKALSFAGKLR
jgi:uncharacterized protein YfaT (DUF1175 family)